MGVTTATASAVSSGGLLSLLLSSTSLLPDEDVPRPIVPATPDHAIFTPWPSEVRSHLADGAPTAPECQFWNASIQYSSQLCTHFSLSRVAVSAAERGVARAVQCASRHDLDCVLSPEIGLSIPAAFVYDVHAGMQMIVAPRLLPHESEQSLVRIATPAGVETPRALSTRRAGAIPRRCRPSSRRRCRTPQSTRPWRARRCATPTRPGVGKT